jgi:transcriptional regulator with XRE-family HTH domain
MKQKAPSLTDQHVANRIRLRRLKMGISQEELAQALNVTFQQVQKYEKGTNRISAGRLYDIAVALSVPLQFFYEEWPAAVEQETDEEVLKLAQMMALPDVVNLIQALTRFRNPRILKLMSELVVAITEEIAKDSPSSEGVTRRSVPGR